MFWIFKKNYEKQIIEKLTPLQNSLKDSFSKIKEDILGIHQKQDKQYEELSKKIEILMTKLEGLEQYNTLGQQENEEDYFVPKPTIVLTEAQQHIFKSLATVHTNSRNPKISFRSLANEAYPGRKHSQIRSTISEYVNVFEELGLVKKTREGKRVFISITKKALKALGIIGEQRLRRKLMKVIEEEG